MPLVKMVNYQAINRPLVSVQYRQMTQAQRMGHELMTDTESEDDISDDNISSDFISSDEDYAADSTANRDLNKINNMQDVRNRNDGNSNQRSNAYSFDNIKNTI